MITSRASVLGDIPSQRAELANVIGNEEDMIEEDTITS
jgi:hypothetical protein